MRGGPSSDSRSPDKDFASLKADGEGAFWTKYDAYILRSLGLKADAATFAKDVGRAFDEIMPGVSNWAPYPETISVLDLLKRRDLKLGVISNATSLLTNVFDNLGMSKYFDTVVISDEVGVRKPSPDIFKIALRRADVTASRSLYVGDMLEVDIVGAKKAGMNAVLIDRTNTYPDARCLRMKDLNFFRTFV
ncbi:MAG: HAD-IA family hydrolase [Thermoplasmata archaeon]|nr:HAD-IA family hydrolase [Thermoplasmata archaeon]